MGSDCYNKWATMHKIIESDSLIDAIQARLQHLQRVTQRRRIVLFQLLQYITQSMAECPCIGLAVGFDHHTIHTQQQGTAVAGR